MPHRYHNPVSIHLGAGSLAQLPAILGGRRAALVTFPEARGLGLTTRIEALLGEHPGLPTFRGAGDDTRKLSAAWLIDQCGWKGHRDGDAGVAASHALVLVNHGHATGAQLLDLARRIAGSVHERFGIAIEPEPRIIGATW